MKFIHKLHHPHLAIFLVRLALALVFLVHGIGKLSHMDSTIAFFGSLGIGAFFAYVIAILEVLGGISMLLGVFTSYFGMVLAGIMVFAIALVKSRIGFLASEMEVVLLLAAASVIFSGPGSISLGKRMHGCDCGTCANHACNCTGKGVCGCDCSACTDK